MTQETQHQPDRLNKLMAQLQQAISQRKEAEANLRYHIAFVQLVTRLSTRFITLPIDQIDVAIHDALEATGRFARVNRCEVFQLHDNEAIASVTHQWNALGTESSREQVQAMVLADFPWIMSQLAGGDVVVVPDTDRLPEAANSVKGILQAEGTRASITAPLLAGEKLLGAIAFDDTHGVRDWSEEMVTLLRIVGDIIANALERQQMESELRASEIRYRQLVETMNEGLAVVDENSILIFLNNRFGEMLGYAPNTMLGQSINQFLDTSNQQILAEQQVQRRLGLDTPYELAWRRQDGTVLYSLIAPVPIFDEAGEFRGSSAVVTNISEQVLAQQLMEQRVESRTRELATLLTVTNNVTATLEIEPLLDLILEQLHTVVTYDGAAILSLQDDVLTVLAHRWSITDSASATLHFPADEIFTNMDELREKQVIIVPDIHSDTLEALSFQKSVGNHLTSIFSERRTWMGVPLLIQDRIIGLLSLDHQQLNFYSGEQAKLVLAFANHVAVALHNAQLYGQAQIAATLEERNRLARELHDSVTQAIYSVNLYADAANLALTKRKYETAFQHIQEVRNMAREAMLDMRLLIFELRAPLLEEEGLVTAIQARLDAVEARSGLQAVLQVEGHRQLPAFIESEIYRVAQEAITNVTKHAKATQVDVTLRFNADQFTLEVCDDGIGFDPEVALKGGGFGLKSIIERVDKLNGDLTLERQAKSGVRLLVELKV